MLVVIIMTGLILMLQVFLSKNVSKWPGLVLPILFLVCSIISTVGVFHFESDQVQITISSTETGEIIENRIDNIAPSANSSTAPILLQSLALFVVSK